MIASGPLDSERNNESVLGTSMIDEEVKELPTLKFKMMMIGDISAGKTDMMAKYFKKSTHEIFI